MKNMIVFITVVLIGLGITKTALISNSSGCRSVCENRVYDISTIDGWKLGSDLKALWYVRRIDDYPSVLIINYQSHVMVQLNWTSMMFEETHDCSNMTLLKLEEHPNLKGCFFLASRNRDNYFMLQKRGKLQIVNGSLANQSLNVQDLRCFNYKQTLTTPEYPDGCGESTLLIHKSDQDVMTSFGDMSTSIQMNDSTVNLIHGTKHFAMHVNASDRTGTIFTNTIHGTSTRKMSVNFTTRKSTIEQKKFNIASMQDYSSSPIGSTSINSSTIFTSKSMNGEQYTIPTDKSLLVTLKPQFIPTTQWHSNSTKGRVRKTKFRTTKHVIFHYNTKYLRKKGSSVNCCNMLIVFCAVIVALYGSL